MNNQSTGDPRDTVAGQKAQIATTYCGESNPSTTPLVYTTSWPIPNYDHLHAYVSVIETLRNVIADSFSDDETKNKAQQKLLHYIGLL